MKKPENSQKQQIKALQKIASHRNERLKSGKLWRRLDFFVSLLAVVTVALLLRSVVAEPARVRGGSMQNTLHASDFLFVEKLTYVLHPPKTGDVVICYYPDEYYRMSNLAYQTRVKRVVAVAGDTVQTLDGRLYVNGRAVEEPYLTESLARTVGIEQPITIAPGEVFVLGDNRGNSNDSRHALVGAIPLERIVGKAHFILFPFSHIRKV